MHTLRFTGRQSIVEADLLLSAELDGEPIGVRISSETVEDYGLAAAKDKAVEKAKAGKFESGGTILVRTTDFN